MNLERLLQAGIHWGDLVVVDSHFAAIGIKDLQGMLLLKAAIVALANVADFEPALRSTYKAEPAPAAVIKPLREYLAFSKYIRNKVVGHIHPEVLTKAILWQPLLRDVGSNMGDHKVTLLVNLWLLETTINTYVDADGKHKVFGGETDLMYPPDWHRFVDFLEVTIRGSIGYLQLVHELWAPKLRPNKTAAGDVALALKAGETDFNFLTR
jgi:hypothetical protein